MNTGQAPAGRNHTVAASMVSASLLALAVSNWMRPAVVSAQAPAAAPRMQMSGASRTALVALEDAFTGIAERVGPSVVTIRARTDRNDAPVAQEPEGPRGPRPARPSTGSGVIVRETGSTVYVLTNNHVVDGRDRFMVQMADQSEYDGVLVGKDARSDLAVLRFQTRRPLPAGVVASFGDSSRVKVGQWAIAIGSPLGYRSTLTLGVVSAKGRELRGPRGSSSQSDLIQTDASITPGNSGGPLVNIDGEIIGINVAIASSGGSMGNIGIGFAIPCDTARYVSEQLIATGKVVRGYLGVSSASRQLTPDQCEKLGCPNGGALVESVGGDTPAGRAGIQAGDVIVRFGGHTIRSFTDLEKAIAATAPGTTTVVEVIRERKAVRLNVSPMERPAEVAMALG